MTSSHRSLPTGVKHHPTSSRDPPLLARLLPPRWCHRSLSPHSAFAEDGARDWQRASPLPSPFAQHGHLLLFFWWLWWRLEPWRAQLDVCTWARYHDPYLLLLVAVSSASTHGASLVDWSLFPRGCWSKGSRSVLKIIIIVGVTARQCRRRSAAQLLTHEVEGRARLEPLDLLLVEGVVHLDLERRLARGGLHHQLQAHGHTSRGGRVRRRARLTDYLTTVVLTTRLRSIP